MRRFDARERTRVVSEVEGGEFDLVVVGGGINGAGVARDAALRGLKVLLLEQRDLAFGTSSRSSKLIHGGLRYLEHYQFKLVFEGTNERAILRRIAPHLVRPLMFALPVYEDDRHPLWLMDVGLWMYDSLSLFKAEKRHITLRSPKRLLEREPCLNPEGLTGGIIYYDCMTDDARLVLENALDAVEAGSVVLTRARVTDIESTANGKADPQVRFEDEQTGRRVRVKARVVVNCTGAWTDLTRRLADVPSDVLSPTKGVHVVLRHERLPVHHATALLSPQDGRVFFVIPWNGRSVIGTTDTAYDGPLASPAVDKGDVDYLLHAANTRFPGHDLVPDDVLSAWVGLRPLIRAEDAESESDISREHRIYTDGRLVTVAGGKLTTYRKMTAEIVDRAVDAASIAAGPSKTAAVKLPGARGLPDRAAALKLDEHAERVEQEHGLPQNIARRLVYVYGVRATDVLEQVRREPALAERICEDQDVIYAEVVHALESELALGLDDFLVRRTSLALTAADQARGAAERVAGVMAERLGWSATERAESLKLFEDSVSLATSFRN